MEDSEEPAVEGNQTQIELLVLCHWAMTTGQPPALTTLGAPGYNSQWLTAGFSLSSILVS